ncbi:hypothetical protein HK100_004569 [Physocladia obscura]|uniref:Uncharacterized protein n=1 Tax=Physocladia obscura TaxID=109957 RepID=A0AAD5XJH8_9FUNG|nr:hypothetical protein HK100_004569 [Physocladia obscura]
MPSCEKFKTAVLECLSESDCVLKRGLSLNQCLDLNNKDVSKECRLAQQFLTERASRNPASLNPRRRLRGAYGLETGKKDEKSDEN